MTSPTALAWLAALVPAFLTTSAAAGEPPPLRLVVIGLVHGHVEGALWNATNRDDLELVGVWDPNRALFDRLASKYGLDTDLYHADLDAMLEKTMPGAASVMTSTADHLMAVRACAPRGVHALVEKPLAINMADAREMVNLSRTHDVHVLTNYETSWYASVRHAHALTRDRGDFTPIRRAVFRHGHKGPREIGCADEFLDWLCRPETNGAGALYDFGCYGANQMTWLMDNQRPSTVQATTQQLKRDRYPLVDDDATIVLTYPTATAVIQASWAWTHDNKDTDLHTEGGSIHCGKWSAMRVREPDGPSRSVEPPASPPDLANEWSHFRAVVVEGAEPDPLATLENNLIVVEILEAARRSAATGQAVTLDP
ncbi:MAG: Gfo/Idh/MocA family oxidoreductase [Planctomycetota bacterium]